MKNQDYTRKTFFSQFWSYFTRNLTALFESGNKREFQRLKDYIAS